MIRLEVSTYDSKKSVLLRHLLKRVGGTVDAPTAVQVTAWTVDGETVTTPIVLMERAES